MVWRWVVGKARKWCSKCKEPHAGQCPKSGWKGYRHKQGSSGRGGTTWQNRRKRIFERDGYLCQEHKRLGKLVSVSLHGINHGVCDHITPLAEGGSDDDENLQTICQSCDKTKTAQEARRGRG